MPCSFTNWGLVTLILHVAMSRGGCLVVSVSFTACFIQNENRRFRVKFSPMRSSVPTSLETCRHFAALLAPLVPIREMDIGTRDEGTSTRDNTISMRAMESDSQLTCCEDSQMLDSSQVVPNQDLLLPEQRYTPLQQPNSHIGGDESAPVSLQPDESKLIPVPDMGKVHIHDLPCLALYLCRKSGPCQLSCLSG